jgi:predicted component of type VI protein secretion system
LLTVRDSLFDERRIQGLLHANEETLRLKLEEQNSILRELNAHYEEMTKEEWKMAVPKSQIKRENKK